MKNRPAFAPVQTEAVKARISGWMAEAAEGCHTPEGYEGMTYRELVKQLHGEVFTDADGGERLLSSITAAGIRSRWTRVSSKGDKVRSGLVF